MSQQDPAEVPKTIDRRKVLIGAAWTAPALVVATSLPAAAASLDPSLGVKFVGGSNQSAAYTPTHWAITAPAINTGEYLQNVGNSTPVTQTMTFVLKLPCGTLTAPRFGLGGNVGAGAFTGTGWTVVGSGPVVSAGIATLTLTSALAWGPWGGQTFSNLWIETSSDPRPANAQMFISATHAGGYTSSDSTTVPIALQAT